MGVLQAKFPYCGPREFSQMGAGPQRLTEIMRQRTYVCSRTHPCFEARLPAIEVHNFELLYFHLLRLQLHFLLLAGKFVGGHAPDLFGGKRWRYLLQWAYEFGRGFPKLICLETHWLRK